MSRRAPNAPEVLPIDPDAPEEVSLDRAARAIRAGRLVAFPTETVYGLGADATNPEAIERIFSATGRPATHPLIVHVGTSEQAAELAEVWPEEARRLADRFWPGPLTLIVPKSGRVPDEVTAGLETVGLRLPSHPVGLAFLRRAGVPIAAPSANPHEQLSPTRAEHVVEGLGASVDLVLDGGATAVGIESTVLSLAEDPPTILRPGAIAREAIEAIVGSVVLGDDAAPDPEARRASPGLAETHYAPHATTYLFDSDRIKPLHDALAGRTGWLLIGDRSPPTNEANTPVERLPADPKAYARGLYAALHELDRTDCDRIAIEAPPREEAWRAVWNRLRRAATELES